MTQTLRLVVKTPLSSTDPIKGQEDRWRQNRPLYFIKGLPFRYTYLIKFYFYQFQYYIKLKLYSLSCDKIFDTQHAWVLFVSLVVAGEWRATAGGRLVLTVVG